jgi:hypothetical protein
MIVTMIVEAPAGKLTRGAEPDTSTAARMVLLDWQRGRLPFFSLPPGCTLEPSDLAPDDSQPTAAAPPPTSTAVDAPESTAALAELDEHPAGVKTADAADAALSGEGTKAQQLPQPSALPDAVDVAVKGSRQTAEAPNDAESAGNEAAEVCRMQQSRMLLAHRIVFTCMPVCLHGGSGALEERCIVTVTLQVERIA